MKNISISAMMLSVLMLFSVAVSAQNNANEHAEDKKEALIAAKQWLESMDKGKFKKSWEETSSFFQQNFEKESWNNSMDSTYSVIGKLEKRELFQSNYHTDLPHAPEGEYVIIQFKSDYTNKEGVTETVIPKKENGEWKVASFFLF